MKAMQIHVAAAIIALAWLGAPSARAAEDKPASKHEELDVTMQIISDPNAKRPDEIVRRIPLPAPKTETKAPSNANRDSSKEVGSEMSETAKERAQSAAEQREEARQSKADEHRQHNNPHPPPTTPPGHNPH